MEIMLCEARGSDPVVSQLLSQLTFSLQLRNSSPPTVYSFFLIRKVTSYAKKQGLCFCSGLDFLKLLKVQQTFCLKMNFGIFFFFFYEFALVLEGFSGFKSAFGPELYQLLSG